LMFPDLKEMKFEAPTRRRNQNVKSIRCLPSSAGLP
jgi:hypothetical protein